MKTIEENKQSQAGFTLVELSIVLVIIGLIIGGVLSGQDLIKAAEVRATVGQIEKYNTAVNTFHDKYNYIPGDLTTSTTTNFGFAARTGAVGHGDGNGILEGCSANASVFGCETALFWNDLSFAQLVGNSFTTSTDSLTTAAAGAVNSYMPEAKLGKGNFITVLSTAGRNYYQLAGIISASAAGVYTLANYLSPQEAYNIDKKADDGIPATGVVRAMDDAAASGALNQATTPAAAAAGVCEESANNTYNTATEAYANSPACQLRFRFN